MLRTNLSRKVAIVTGGTGGIGSTMSEALALNGAIVYFTGRKEDAGARIMREIAEKGGKAYFLKGNVSSEEDTRRIVETVISEQGRLNILINNAGGNIPLERRGKIYKYFEDAWHETIDCCLDGDYFFTKYATEHLARTHGRIITVGSVTGFRMGLRNQSAYNMVKAAIHNYTRCCASELAPMGITINCIIPGTTWVQSFKDMLLKQEGMREKFLSHVPIGEANNAWDMANAALFFASDEAEHITGVLLPVDGGWSAGFCRAEA